MHEDKDDDVNKLNEDELEIKHFVQKGNKLKWTWIVGVPVIMVCIVYGDAAQWVLAVVVTFYIYISTVNYFK